MKALVTGGGGFLGGEILRLLHERGDNVRTFSRSGHSALDALGVEQVHGDLADADAVSAAVHGSDIVFHVAAKTGVWGRWADYYTANVVGTRNVVAACRKHGIPRLVFTSSPSVTFAGKDQNGVNEAEPYPAKYLAHYSHTKALAEQEVLAVSGRELATVALRPHLIWGPGDPNLIPQLVARARAGRLRRIGNGRNLVDTTYVENAAIAHVQAADRLSPGSPIAGRAYFVSQGDPQPLWDFANRILGCAGLSPVIRGVSAPLAYTAAVALEGVHRLLPFFGDPPITRFVVRQLSTAHWFDLTAAERDLGYVPKVSTDEGLRRVAEWFKRSQS